MPTENGVYGVDGAYLSAEGYPQGWSLIDGTYYYKEGENFVFNQAKKINGDWYLFDVHGRMVTGFSTVILTLEDGKTIITMMAISTMEQTEEDATMLDGR